MIKTPAVVEIIIDPSGICGLAFQFADAGMASELKERFYTTIHDVSTRVGNIEADTFGNNSVLMVLLLVDEAYGVEEAKKTARSIANTLGVEITEFKEGGIKGEKPGESPRRPPFSAAEEIRRAARFVGEPAVSLERLGAQLGRKLRESMSPPRRPKD